MDEEHAREGPYGQRIAHGLLSLVLMNGRVPMAPGRVVALFGMDRVRFLRPVYFGDTIHAEMEVTAKHDRGPGGVVTFSQVVRNQRSEPVVKGEIKVMMSRRPA